MSAKRGKIIKMEQVDEKSNAIKESLTQNIIIIINYPSNMSLDN